MVFGGTAGDMPRHPSQLYEAFLEGIVLFCILQVLSRKKPLLPQGTFMGVFVMSYGIVRFLIEFVRVPMRSWAICWAASSPWVSC